MCHNAGDSLMRVKPTLTNIHTIMVLIRPIAAANVALQSKIKESTNTIRKNMMNFPVAFETSYWGSGSLARF